MSYKIFFGNDSENLHYTIDSIKSITFSIINKFHTQSMIDSNADEILPNRQKSHMNIDCTAAVSQSTEIIQRAAIFNHFLYYKITTSDTMQIIGKFYISNFTIQDCQKHVPEFSFTLQNSGEYSLSSK